jgi:ubiquinone biosynthesis protein UbiJ
MSLAEDAINRALERESWAREKLAAHAGRAVRLTSGPIDRAFAIGADGRLSATQATPDLTLTISPLGLPALLGAPERWTELVAVEGDAALAATLAELALTLPWFIEQMFARALGPIVGQQVADTGRRLLALPGYAAQRFGESLARYLADEARLALGAAEARAFAVDVAATAARVDALAVRIDALAGASRREAPA